MPVLRDWIERLGVETRVLLKRYNKRIITSLASITCTNMNKRRIQPKLYTTSSLIAETLTGCGCRYVLTHEHCEADIVLDGLNYCGMPVFAVYRSRRHLKGYDIVSCKPTVVPGRYLLEVNEIGFLVDMHKCGIRAAVLTPEERLFLETIRPYIEDYGYLDVGEAVSIISTRYMVTKSKARRMLIENSERGIIGLEGRRVFIPFHL